MRPYYLTLEPDQAEAYVIRLIGEGRRHFVVECDERVKDTVVVSVGGEFIERPSQHYLRTRQVVRDDACQWAVNLIRAGLSFSVRPERTPDGRTEYLVHVERERR